MDRNIWLLPVRLVTYLHGKNCCVLDVQIKTNHFFYRYLAILLNNGYIVIKTKDYDKKQTIHIDHGVAAPFSCFQLSVNKCSIA